MSKLPFFIITLSIAAFVHSTESHARVFGSPGKAKVQRTQEGRPGFGVTLGKASNKLSDAKFFRSLKKANPKTISNVSRFGDKIRISFTGRGSKHPVVNEIISDLAKNSGLDFVTEFNGTMLVAKASTGEVIDTGNYFIEHSDAALVEQLVTDGKAEIPRKARKLLKTNKRIDSEIPVEGLGKILGFALYKMKSHTDRDAFISITSPSMRHVLADIATNRRDAENLQKWVSALSRSSYVPEKTNKEKYRRVLVSAMKQEFPTIREAKLSKDGKTVLVTFKKSRGNKEGLLRQADNQMVNIARTFGVNVVHERNGHQKTVAAEGIKMKNENRNTKALSHFLFD